MAAYRKGYHLSGRRAPPRFVWAAARRRL